jgi:hypothetical protein
MGDTKYRTKERDKHIHIGDIFDQPVEKHFSRRPFQGKSGIECGERDGPAKKGVQDTDQLRLPTGPQQIHLLRGNHRCSITLIGGIYLVPPLDLLV